MKFKVNAKVTNWLEIEIDADSLEMAQEIADRELITDDFEVVRAEFELGEVEEVTE